MNQETTILLKRGIHRGMRTLLRERGFAMSVGALLGIAVIVQLLLLGSMSLRGVVTLLKSRTDLLLELQEGVADADIRSLFAEIQSLPSVEEVTYITREQAFETVRRRNPDFVSFLEQYEIENPFHDTIAVTLHDLEDYDAFAAFIRSSQWSAVIDPSFLTKQTEQEAQIRQMLSLVRAGSSLILIVLALTAGVLIAVLMELVRKRALLRSEEILVERLSGAHTLSIVAPFVTEATVLLALSFLGSIALLTAFLFLLPALVPALQSGGAFDAVRGEMLASIAQGAPWLLLLEILAIPTVAFLGAWMGIRKQIGGRRLQLV